MFQDACGILARELKQMDDRGSPAIGNHLRQNILPGFACYSALLHAGVPEERAVNFVQGEMCKSAQRMAKFSKKLSGKECAYPVFRFLFGLGLKTMYPKQGWTIQYIENSGDRIRMDITTCLYCEELEKRGARALCRAFCETDHASYDPLAPSVVFRRKGTLADTGKQCDFCFEKGKKA